MAGCYHGLYHKGVSLKEAGTEVTSVCHVLPCPDTGLHVFCPKTGEEGTGEKRKKRKKKEEKNTRE